MGTPEADDVGTAAEPGEGDAAPGWWRRNAWNLVCWGALVVGATTFGAVVYGPWQAALLGGFGLVMFAVRGIAWRG